MANWLAGRRAVKMAGGIWGTDKDSDVDRLIEAASRDIESECRRFFIPRTETRLYRWPPRGPNPSNILWLDQDLLTVTTLKTKAQDASPTTIAAADYFLEPANTPPYQSIEIDLSSAAAFEPGATPQRSISVLGSWGYSAVTKTGGTVASGLASDATVTSFVSSRSDLIDVGDTLLIGTEQLFVSDVSNALLGAILLNGALTADQAEVSITLDNGHGVLKGEVLLLNSEKVYVEAVSGNVLTVIRAWDGSVLAAHADDTPVYIYRTYTVVRGVNGTTAAVHANASAISIYTPPTDVVALAVAETITAFHQERAGWGRVVGGGEGAREWTGRGLASMHKRVVDGYQRLRSAAV